MKHTFWSKIQTLSFIIALLLVSFSASVVTAATSDIDEKEVGKWISIGEGTLIDGWVTNGDSFQVEIQQDKENPSRFRVWDPYKELREKAGADWKSNYTGQIVFDISDPECVLVEFGKPIGYYFDGAGSYKGEMYPLNDYGYFFKQYKGDEKPSLIPTIKKLTRNYGVMSVYDNSTVIIPQPEHLNAEFTASVNKGKIASQIIMPWKEINWVIKSPGDYFDFKVDGEEKKFDYDPSSNSYEIKGIEKGSVLEATIKSTNYLIDAIDVEKGKNELIPIGGSVSIIKRNRGFSIPASSFGGDFIFTVNVNNVGRSQWEIVADDLFEFFDSDGDKFDRATYNVASGSYKISNPPSITAKLKDDNRYYRITDITFEAQHDLSQKAAESDEDGLPEIKNDGREFSIDNLDFVGNYKFIVTTIYDGSNIRNVQKPVVSVSSNSASVKIKYETLDIPERGVIKAFYGPSNQDASEYEDFVIGLESTASITLTGLTSDTPYEYNVIFAVYTEDGEEFSPRSIPIKVKFETLKDPVVADGITAEDYFWESTVIPENKYALFSFTSYDLGQTAHFPEITPEIEVVKGSYFTKSHEKGVRELTIHLAHMLPSPPYVTDDQNIYTTGKWFIIKNHTGETGKKETFFIPETPEGWDDNDGTSPYGQIIEKGDTYKGLQEQTMYYYEKVGDSLTDYRWKIDTVNYFALETNQKVYNAILVIGFDEDDEEYETPISIRLDYEKEPLTALIGTIAQTSPLFDPEKDKTGGWQTWVPLTPTGNSDNPYPYVYDFVAKEKSYDFSFTFDNKRLFDTFGKNGVMNSFYLQEVYPHNMAWNSGFESPSNWNSKTRGRDIKAQQTNYFPGYIGPYIDGRNETMNNGDIYEPSTLESIRLTNLEPGHHYQLVIDHPSYGWETDPNNQTFTYIDNALGYVTLIDYDINDGKIFTYQLVKDTQVPAGNVYYTYDFYNSGKTFKVILGENDKVLSYQEIEDFNEQNAYLDQNFLFTDKLFVFTTGYKYEEVDENDISVRVLNVHADVVVKKPTDSEDVDNEENKKDTLRKEFNFTGKDAKIAQVFSMGGITEPLKAKDVEIQKYTLTYQRGYTTCKDNTLELFVTDSPNPKHWLISDYNNDLKGLDKKKNHLRTYDPQTIRLNDVKVPGQLVVPTPMYKTTGVKVYYGSDETPATDDAHLDTDDKVYFTYTSKYDTEFPLPKARYHNLQEKPAVYVANVSDDLIGILNEDSYSYKHWYCWKYAGEDATLEIADVKDETKKGYAFEKEYSTSGIYLPSHFIDRENLGFEMTRTDEIGDVAIFNRWVDADNGALNLTTVPPLNNDVYNNTIWENWCDWDNANKEGNSDVSNVAGTRKLYYKGIPSDDHLYEDFDIFISLDGKNQNVIVTSKPSQSEPEQAALTAGDLMLRKDFIDGDNLHHWGATSANAESTDYYYVTLVEPDTDNLLYGYLDADRSQLVPLEFVATVEDLSYSDKHGKTVTVVYDWGHWYAEQVDDVMNSTVNREVEIRVSYLYPFYAPTQSTPANGKKRMEAQVKDTDVVKSGATVWKINASEIPTSVEGIGEGGRPQLARVHAGYVEILVDGAVMYRADGSVAASGAGYHDVTPGVYIVRKDRQVQKIIVR